MQRGGKEMENEYYVNDFLPFCQHLLAFPEFRESSIRFIRTHFGVRNNADIGFLSMVSNADLSASRGSSKKEATIKGVSYTAGKTLSNADAKAITGAIMDFQKDYKAPDASRGAEELDAQDFLLD